MKRDISKVCPVRAYDKGEFLGLKTAREWAELLLLRTISRLRPGSDNLSLITVMVR